VSKLRIAVNTRLLLKNKLEGIGWFTYESLKRIVTAHPEAEFIFIFDRRPDASFLFAPNVSARIIPPQARHPFLFYLWFNLSLPQLLRKIKPDLFLSPDGYNALPYKGKSLIVIHDLNFEHHPDDLPCLVRRYYRYFFPKFAAKATRIATVSEYSKSDIRQHYHIAPEKIDVVYDGVNEALKPLTQDECTQIREQLCQGDPFFVFIGSLHPRKNLAMLFRAFDHFRNTSNSRVCLVIAGAKKWWTRDIQHTYQQMQHRDDVIFTGRLSVSELNRVLGASLALVYISYFEGFGIPLLEAFACKVPVIASNITSLPEIAGDAAILVDPFNEADIATAMHQITDNEHIREQLIAKGTSRLASFSWERTASLLWDSMIKTIKHPDDGPKQQTA